MREYSYSEAISFFEELPHFKPPINTGKPLKDMFSLDAELALLQELGNPHKDLKYVHVAGTNGKGSTVAYISSILDKAGLKVGTFSSPFLFSYNEMFLENGKEISDEDFVKIFSVVKPAYDKLAEQNIMPSEYEILTVMAFVYFKSLGCDIVVMEVSMGGRVDTTNVIPAPLVTVITPISFDHMSILGNTLAEIATEKAGIIKLGTVVVSAKQEQEVIEVLENKVKDLQVPISYSKTPDVLCRSLGGQIFKTEDGQEFTTTMLGTYQVENASLAILVAEKLKELGFDIHSEAIAEGIESATWFGRFSLINRNPNIIIDGGHNRQGAKVLRRSLNTYFPQEKIIFVIGILKDKEVDEILGQLMPIAKKVYATSVPNDRSLAPEELAEKVRKYGVEAEVLEDNAKLKELVNADETLCICGSLYLIKSIMCGEKF